MEFFAIPAVVPSMPLAWAAAEVVWMPLLGLLGAAALGILLAVPRHSHSGWLPRGWWVHGGPMVRS